ncbi:hypothetical protein ACOMHN_049246 [Nucella lapillus]
MASSSSVMTSSMTNTISYIGVSTTDDDVTYRMTPKREAACNGLVRNASLSTITVSSPCPLPHSRSAQNVKRSVSTVFSSNHRRSWQCSLSNYSRDPSPSKEDTPSSAQPPESQEVFAVRQGPELEGSAPREGGGGGGGGGPGLDRAQSRSVVVVYPEDRAVQRCVQDTPKPRPPVVPTVRVTVDGEEEEEEVEVVCQGGGTGAEGSSCAGVHGEKQGSGKESGFRGTGVGVSGPPCGSGTGSQGCSGHLLAWSSHAEPHHIRHHPPHHHHHHHRSHSSPSPCGVGDSMEMSLYHVNSSAAQPSLHTDNNRQGPHAINQRQTQSRAALQSHSQSVSALRTTDHPDPSSHGTNRRDSERAVRYSSHTDHNGRPKCRLLHREYDGEKEGGVDTTLCGCPPDTQPLLSPPRVRVEGASSCDNPDMCAENTLLRFHSLDSKDSGSKETERTPTMQRAVSINSPHTLSGLAGDSSSSLLGGAAGGPPARGGSPTGSDSLAAPALNELYRYHVFLSHCAQDAGWAEDMVVRLQAPPYCYQCAYTPPLSEHDPTSLEQKLLCSAMLSERVVMVLSKQYVQETWFVFERVLRQLTQMSLHNQRIMGVLLEDCEIPDTLGELYFLDTSDTDFFDVFTKRLKTGELTDGRKRE